LSLNLCSISLVERMETKVKKKILAIMGQSKTSRRKTSKSCRRSKRKRCL